MFFRSPIVRFFNRILNRVTITVVLVALQLLWLCWVFYSITTGTGRVWVNGLLNALSLLIILYLVRKDENSAYKVGWIALIGILPLLGGALYLAFGNKRPSKRLSLKMHAVDSAHKKDLQQQPGVLDSLDAGGQGQSRYVAKMFLNFWNAFRPSETDYDAFRPMPLVPLVPDGVVQPYADSPLDEEPMAETVYLNILAQAKQYVYIYTPYLAIGEEMLDALKNAAKRGVDVRLVLPGIPDKKLVFRLSRSYYLPLLRAGVRIYEFTPGFLHAKCWVSDDSTAVVGSINMDYRSLFLHFECGVLLQNNSQVTVLRDDVRDTLPKCREVQVSDCHTGLLGTVLDSVLRLLSPLM